MLPDRMPQGGGGGGIKFVYGSIVRLQLAGEHRRNADETY
jgi:hypothetical protein